MIYDFQKGEHKQKKTEHGKFDSNSAYCCSIFRPLFLICLQLYRLFVNIYLFQLKLEKKAKIH